MPVREGKSKTSGGSDQRVFGGLLGNFLFFRRMVGKNTKAETPGFLLDLMEKGPTKFTA